MRRAVLVLLVGIVAGLAAAPAAHADVRWLCRPGLAHDPCTVPADTARYAPDGRFLGRDAPRATRRRIDCFYVYPTVSGQPTRHRDPADRSGAPVDRPLPGRPLRAHAAASSRRSTGRSRWRAWPARPPPTGRGRCGRQGRLADLPAPLQPRSRRRPDRPFAGDVPPPRPAPAGDRAAPRAAPPAGLGAPARRQRDRRGGARHRRRPRLAARLSQREPDALRDRVLDLRGQRPRPTRSSAARAIPARAVLCTNPAALGGGAGPIDPIVPSRPFAPGTAIAAALAGVGFPFPRSSADWIRFPGAYEARCSDADGANVLQVTPRRGAPALNAVPAAPGACTWSTPTSRSASSTRSSGARRPPTSRGGEARRRGGAGRRRARPGRRRGRGRPRSRRRARRARPRDRRPGLRRPPGQRVRRRRPDARRPRGYARAAAAMLATGVTAYLPTFVTAPEPDVLAALRAAAPGRARDPRRAPGGAVPRAAAGSARIRRSGGATPTPRCWTACSRAAGDPRDARARAARRAGADRRADRARDHGRRRALRRDRGRGPRGFDRGIRTVTHLFNAMRRPLPRDPGIALAALARPTSRSS